jgi:hypothetical protein
MKQLKTRPKHGPKIDWGDYVCQTKPEYRDRWGSLATHSGDLAGFAPL